MKSPNLNTIKSLPTSADSLAGATANVFGGATEEQVRDGKLPVPVEGFGTSPAALGGITGDGGVLGRPVGWER